MRARLFGQQGSLGLALLALLAGACTGSFPGAPNSNGGSGQNQGGTIGSGGTDEPSPATDPTYTCNANAVPDSIGLRKLTGVQYKNTIRDLVRFALHNDEQAINAAMAAIGPELDKFPADERYRNNHHPINRQMNQALQQMHVEESYAIAVKVGQELTSGARLGRLAGSCATDSNTGNDAQCLNDFIQRFGERALRRPLSSEDVTFYRDRFYGTNTAMNPAAWADLVSGLLLAPDVFYFVESGTEEVPGKNDLYNLAPHEVAARLSYHFLHTMPDDELWAAARSGDLLQQDEYQRQVNRLLDKAEARRFTREFFEDYLRVADIERVDRNRDNPKFRAFAGDNLPSSMLQQALQEDVVGMAQWLTWDKNGGSVNDMLSSQQSFARSQELASIYGVSVWDGSGDPPSFPAEQERHGIFTRAAFFVTGMVSNRPIMKGVHLRTSWLCDEIPPPPPGAANEPVDTVNRTSREAVELITEQEGTTCKGCHQLYTNPLGFATESFDGIGRYRTAEQVFDANEQPNGTRPINTRSIPQVVIDDMTESSGPADLMRLVRESGKVEYCLAQHYFRFSFARYEDLQRDGCALEALRSAARGNSLRGMFARVAMLPDFRQRLITTQ